MNQPISTQEKLLSAARNLFWTRGYSNVSVRDIAKDAGADAALVSRYFGSKQGLFEATLSEIPPWPALNAAPGDLLDAAAASFSRPFDPCADQANPFTMLMANVNDPEMGQTVREMVQRHLADPLAEKLGGPEADTRAAMLLGALFGMALMRKHFQLEALASGSVNEIEAQIRHLAQAAMRFAE
ncbi:MAG: TetR family transcriptional regulator [Pseudomonadota bacterium]